MSACAQRQPVVKIPKAADVKVDHVGCMSECVTPPQIMVERIGDPPAVLGFGGYAAMGVLPRGVIKIHKGSAPGAPQGVGLPRAWPKPCAKIPEPYEFIRFCCILAQNLMTS